MDAPRVAQVNYLVRVIEGNSSRATHGVADGRLAHEEVAEFEAKQRLGKGLTQLSGDAARLGGLKAAMAHTHQKLLEALHRVDIFSALAPAQLELLCNTMNEVRAARAP